MKYKRLLAEMKLRKLLAAIKSKFKKLSKFKPETKILLAFTIVFTIPITIIMHISPEVLNVYSGDKSMFDPCLGLI